MKRAFVLLVCLFLASSLFGAGQLMVLTPTQPGGKSDLIPIEELPRVMESQHSRPKGGIENANYIIEYIDGEYPDFEWYYYVPRDVGDTLCVWFDPPAACTLVAISRIWYFGGDASGTEGTPYQAFVAYTAPGITLDSLDIYPGSPGPSPIGEWIVPPTDMIAPNESFAWDTLLVPNVDVGRNSFIGGYVVGAENQATLSDDESHPTYHSVFYRTAPPTGEPGWYRYDVDFGIVAFVIAYEDLPPKVTMEYLPWSYTTDERVVRAYAKDILGVPEDVWGLDHVTLYYNVNGGDFSAIEMVLVEGDDKDGVWEATIPGVEVGDSVSYYMIGVDKAGLADTTEVWWYKIIEGTPGNIFFYNDDYYGGPSPLPPDFVGMVYENVDYWDGEVQGTPDESVIGFYTPGKGPGAPVVLWNSWGGETFAEAVGAGVIQSFLDAGGNLFMSGQDFLYGLAGTYEQVEWEAGTFPYDYLKFYVTTDDPVIVSPNDYATFYGGPEDTITAPFEEGIYVWPYIWNGRGLTWCGEIVETDAIPIFFYEEGEISGARYESDKGYKYVFLYWPFAYIVEVEADTWTGAYDVDAEKTLVRRILQWFGLEVGVEEEPMARPAIHVPTVFTNAINISYEVSNELPLDVKLYDLTGRKLDELNIKLTGKGTYSWDASHLPVGVYFMKLYLGDRSTTHKLVKLR
ncbi:T9SS type A sorting domain-containing protein [candidate division WOR-3 bacterium]|nr:T9SS type A sorting domain-containing protein [candidate division WOR-3 bacterium]